MSGEVYELHFRAVEARNLKRVIMMVCPQYPPCNFLWLLDGRRRGSNCHFYDAFDLLLSRFRYRQAWELCLSPTSLTMQGSRAFAMQGKMDPYIEVTTKNGAVKGPQHKDADTTPTWNWKCMIHAASEEQVGAIISSFMATRRAGTTLLWLLPASLEVMNVFLCRF